MAVTAKQLESVKSSKPAYFKMTGYEPHKKQLLVHRADARFRVVVAGRRWGKSLSAAKEAECMILHPGLNGRRGTRGWVVSKTYDLTMKVLREIYEDLIMEMKLKPTKIQMAGPYIIQFPWGSTVEGKSADHPESLLGEGLDWVIFDECAKCKSIIWDSYLRPTLTDREGWALFITTPNGYNWVYDLWKRGPDPDFPEWASWQSPSWDNPHLSRPDIEEARSTIPKAAFFQEYGAKFTMAAGQVYEEFDEEVHVMPDSQMKIGAEWPRYRAIDFGYENPSVSLWIAVDPEDRVYVYDEYYQRHRTVDQLADYINGYTPACDKAQLRGTGAYTKPTEYEYNVSDIQAKEQRVRLRKKGIPTLAMKSGVDDGLDEVRKQLEIRADRLPGLLVSSRCVNTILEFNRYSYPDTADNENPVKQYDHSMDALRYFIVYWRRGYITQSMPRL